MRNKALLPNINNSDLANYPNGRINDNDGTNNGTEVSEKSYGDIHEFFGKLMRLAELEYNNVPDNEQNGYQTISALKSIANKNDLIKIVSSEAGFLTINTKLSGLETGEFFICKSSVDLASETQIRGSNGTSFVFDYAIADRKFKAGDYLILIRNEANFSIVRKADAENLNQLVSELYFLKGATEAEEFEGTSLVKATTPYTNQLAFARRVIGLDSSIFLASLIRNGLYPKEHFSIVAGLTNEVINKGWFSNFDVGGNTPVGTDLPTNGNISSAKYLAQPNNFSSAIEVTMQNPMPNDNYKVDISVESLGGLAVDNKLTQFVFKKINNSKFIISTSEVQGGVQNLKVHLEVKKL